MARLLPAVSFFLFSTLLLGASFAPGFSTPAELNSGNPFIDFLYADAVSGAVDCAAEYQTANATIDSYGPNWRDTLERQRQNFTEQLPVCKQNLTATDYLPGVADFLDYELNFVTCPEQIDQLEQARSNWMVVAIVFIVAFVLSTGGFAAVSVLFYRNLRQNHA